MMASKARLFGDKIVLAQIMRSTSPSYQKQLGRRVSNFDEATWNSAAPEIVYMGNMHKFAQNPAFLTELLGTGSRVLVEASPVDRIWGVGLAATDPRILDPAKWRGQNLLGRALMRVRDALASGCVPSGTLL